MSKTTELEINTVVVSGKRNLFKAALSRSILGVTFKKFKRKKQEFYKHRVHNEAVTESVFDWVYESLLMHLRNIGNLEVKTNLRLQWNENGKIMSVSDITASVYMKVGELKVNKLQVNERLKNVKIDLFYSEIDAGSQKLRLDLPQLMKTLGDQNFDYTEHNFLTTGKKMAETYNIKTVPSVMINAEKIIVNPDERKLRQEIERAFTATVKPSDDPQFIPDLSIKPNVELISRIKI